MKNENTKVPLFDRLGGDCKVKVNGLEPCKKSSLCFSDYLSTVNTEYNFWVGKGLPLVVPLRFGWVFGTG